MMKTNYLFYAIVLAVFVCGGSRLSAQDRPAKERFTPEHRMEIRARHMQERLMLDEKTGEKFVSLYKEYLRDLQDCRKEPLKGELTDARIKENLKKELEMKRSVIETKEKYLDKFSKFLSARQLEVVFKSPRRPSARHFRPHCSPGCHHKEPWRHAVNR